MKNYFLIIFLSLISFAPAQNYLFDSVTKAPVKSAHVSFNKNRGLITNDDGYFELPDDTTIDTIYLSHISYISRKIPQKHCSKNDTIFLTQNHIELDEIVLSSVNPKDIVLKAINSIDKNYIRRPHNLIGFFRQSLKEDTKGIEMIEVEFISYLKNNKTSAKIISAKRTENYSKWGLETHGGVVEMIEKGDFVRRKSYFLDINQLNDYKFIYEGKINHEGLKVYKISFIPVNQTNLQNIRKGVIYIDSISYAIVEIRYVFDNEKLLELNRASEKNVSVKKPVYVLNDVENVIKYQQLPDKTWSLFYLDACNLSKGNFNGETHSYLLRSKLIINEIKIKKASEIKTNYNLSKDFNKVVKKFKRLKNWSDTYKFSLSKEEIEILKDIKEKQNNKI